MPFTFIESLESQKELACLKEIYVDLRDKHYALMEKSRECKKNGIDIDLNYTNAVVTVYLAYKEIYSSLEQIENEKEIEQYLHHELSFLAKQINDFSLIEFLGKRLTPTTAIDPIKTFTAGTLFTTRLLSSLRELQDTPSPLPVAKRSSPVPTPAHSSSPLPAEARAITFTPSASSTQNKIKHTVTFSELAISALRKTVRKPLPSCQK